MNRLGAKKEGWFGIPPWLILGAVIVLVPLFVFWAHENINKQKEHMTRLLLEKGAALIRSFEAGARTGMMGMMGMHGSRFQLQKLLMETAQQPDIAYLMVTDIQGTILAHNNPGQIGNTYAKELDLARISRSEGIEWRKISGPDGPGTFEVFRRFLPTHGSFQGRRGGMMPNMFNRPLMNHEYDASTPGLIIFVGLDMGPIETATTADTRHTVAMGIILLLIGFAGIVFLFLAQAYRSTRLSLTRVKAFSDSVVENMPIGLLAVDADGRLASFNQTAESILRLSSAEVLGKRADEMLPGQLACLIGELTTDKDVIEKELECHPEDGRKIPLDVSVSALKGDNDAFLGNIILFRDLTEIQDLKREVERSQRLASLGRLAAGVAHEIRNPLSSIKGFATYFKERYRDVPEDKNTAEIMVQEVDRLNRVIGQLLELARPVEVQKKPVSIQKLLQHSLKMIEREAQSKTITIDTHISPEVQQMHIDPDRINHAYPVDTG